jgi:hypothetical protein
MRLKMRVEGAYHKRDISLMQRSPAMERAGLREVRVRPDATNALPAVATTLALVAMEIFAVVAAIAPVAPEIAMVATLRPSVTAKLVAVVAHLALAPRRAILVQLTSVAPAIAIVGADVAATASQIAPIAAEVAPVGTDVARVATHLTGPLQRRCGLRVRDRGSTGRKRHRDAECNEFVAKHLEILQRSVGARPHHRAVRGGRLRQSGGVKEIRLSSVSQKRWYRSAPGCADPFPLGEYVAGKGLTHN